MVGSKTLQELLLFHFREERTTHVTKIAGSMYSHVNVDLGKMCNELLRWQSYICEYS